MKVGIMGAGHIAVSMAKAINGLDGRVEAYAVASRDIKKAERFAKKHGIAKAYGSYEEMLYDPQVDLVYIATPHSHHFKHGMMCIEHGKPVLCEKSFTENAEQARELLNAARNRKVFITEAIWTRYMPSRKMINDIIDSGVIGNPMSLNANLGYSIMHKERLKNPALAGGALLDVGVYPINFASMVFGNDICQIQSTCTKLDTGVDAQENITFIYRDGRMASLFATMQATTDRSGVIYGDKGYIHVQNINNCQRIRVVDNSHNIVQDLEVPGQINGYEYEVLACLDALENGKLECDEMPHSETIRIMEIMDELRAQWGVKFPDEI